MTTLIITSDTDPIMCKFYLYVKIMHFKVKFKMELPTFLFCFFLFFKKLEIKFANWIEHYDEYVE